MSNWTTTKERRVWRIGKAFELRSAGWTFKQIAEELGCSYATARDLFEAAKLKGLCTTSPRKDTP